MDRLLMKISQWITSHQGYSLGIILLIGFLARMHLTLQIPPFGGSDELKHVITARYIAENGIRTPPDSPIFFQNGVSTIAPIELLISLDSYAHSVYSKVPKLYHAVISLPYRFLSAIPLSFSDIAQRLRLFQSMIGIGGIICFFFLAGKIFKNQNDMLTATYLYATIPLLLYLDSTVNWDSAVAAIGTLCVSILFTTLKKPSITKTIITSLFLSITYLVKPTAIFLFASLASWILLYRKNRLRLIIILLLASLFLVPYFLQNIREYGTAIIDPQKKLFQSSIDASWKDKIYGMSILYSRHSSLLYPQNHDVLPIFLEPLRLILVSSGIIGISIIMAFGIISILRKHDELYFFFAGAPIIYFILYFILEWQYVPGLASIPDRSARMFSSMFFCIPVITIYGMNELKKKNQTLHQYGTPVLFFLWNILVIQTVFL